MGFFSRAYDAAADEYGRRNVDHYARLAKLRVFLAGSAVGILLVLVVVAYVLGR